jgi:hypothetical protein
MPGKSCLHLVGEVHYPILYKPGQPRRIDDEYIRKGVVDIFMEVEPLAGKRHVTVTERRTRKDWVHQIKEMFDDRYPNAIRVRLVMDNLNTYNISSLYETFEPQEARRLANWLDIHYTPKHGEAIVLLINPMANATLYFGGVLKHARIWFGVKCPSSIPIACSRQRS